MKIIHRAIEEDFISKLFNGKVVILYGPRQSGKTTFLKRVLESYTDSVYINCDVPENRAGLSPKSAEELLHFVGPHSLVVIDEAQRVEDIGITLKILVDTYPHVQVIATGSSSFDLENSVAEPLTGRHYDFMFFPPTYAEIANLYPTVKAHEATFEDRLLYGSYPEVLFPAVGDTARERIQIISDDYAMKDILAFEGLRKSDTLVKVLQVLAYQIGSEVSYNEIAQNFGITQKTVERYIDILEKAFIVFRLPPYVGNKRTGLRRTRKIYFWDVGMRNALVRAFQPLDLRPDKGALFENYVVSEMLKKNLQQKHPKKYYFWRAYDGEEIDLIEEGDEGVVGYEIKWKHDTQDIYKTAQAPVQKVQVVTAARLREFLGVR